MKPHQNSWIVDYLSDEADERAIGVFRDGVLPNVPEQWRESSLLRFVTWCRLGFYLEAERCLSR